MHFNDKTATSLLREMLRATEEMEDPTKKCPCYSSTGLSGDYTWYMLMTWLCQFNWNGEWNSANIKGEFIETPYKATGLSPLAPTQAVYFKFYGTAPDKRTLTVVYKKTIGTTENGDKTDMAKYEFSYDKNQKAWIITAAYPYAD